MSQIYKTSSGGGGLPPTVATSYVTDKNSPAVPAMNVLDVFGNITSANNNFGIQTDGSSGSNVLTVQLTNTLINAFSTAGAVTVPALDFTLAASPTAYQFNFQCIGRDTGIVNAVGFDFYVTAFTDGASASIVGTPPIFQSDPNSLAGVIVSVTTSVNDIILNVTGVAGHNISYFVKGTYIQI